MTFIRKRKAPMRKKAVFKRRARSSRGTSAASVKRIVKSQLAKAIEKKVADPVFTPIGQTIEFGSTNNNGTTAGWQALDINPVVPQGVSQNQRIGNRIGITSGHMQLQMQGMASQFKSVPYKIMIILRKNVSTSESPATTVKNFFVPNPFSGQIDSTSSFNVNMRSNYQIVRMVRGVLPAAQTTTINGVPNQSSVGSRSLTMGFKFKKPLVQRYNDDNSTLSTRNDMILVYLAGNDSDVSDSTAITSKFYFESYYNDA